MLRTHNDDFSYKVSFLFLFWYYNINTSFLHSLFHLQSLLYTFPCSLPNSWPFKINCCYMHKCICIYIYNLPGLSNATVYMFPGLTIWHWILVAVPCPGGRLFLYSHHPLEEIHLWWSMRGWRYVFLSRYYHFDTRYMFSRLALKLHPPASAS